MRSNVLEGWSVLESSAGKGAWEWRQMAVLGERSTKNIPADAYIPFRSIPFISLHKKAT